MEEPVNNGRKHLKKNSLLERCRDIYMISQQLTTKNEQQKNRLVRINKSLSGGSKRKCSKHQSTKNSKKLLADEQRLVEQLRAGAQRGQELAEEEERLSELVYLKNKLHESIRAQNRRLTGLLEAILRQGPCPAPARVAAQL
jgi:hypothetical protein